MKDHDCIQYIKELPEDNPNNDNRIDFVGGMHKLRNPHSKRFVQEHAAQSQMVSIYQQPLSPKEIKKIQKGKLIKVDNMVTSKDEVADIINYKILWEPESEPNANE